MHLNSEAMAPPSSLFPHLWIKKKELLTRCASVRSPHPGAYEAFGRRFQVPCRREGPVTPKACSSLLAMYFTMFGSLSFESRDKGGFLAPTLSVAKDCRRGELLHLFLEELGGGIFRPRASQNLLTHPQCVWRVRGDEAALAAQAISKIKGPYQEKLRILGSEGWPHCPEERKRVRREVEDAIWDPTNHFQIENLKNVANFLDVCGSVYLGGSEFNRLRMRIPCPSAEEISQISDIVKSSFGCSFSPSVSAAPAASSRFRFVLFFEKDREVRDILAGVREFLILSRKDAEKALATSPASSNNNVRLWYGEPSLSSSLSSAARVLPEYQEALTELHRVTRRVNASKAQGGEEPKRGKPDETRRKELEEKVEKIKLEAQIEFLEKLLQHHGEHS